ncbi:MAG: hypothetical protein JO080_05930 [Mucilaginibacter sp.]|nr:hypothetical protein [Mucilaginibacter sp.]
MGRNTRQTNADTIAWKLSEEEKEMLNLIAEIAIQIIIKETEDECNRVRKDQ